MFGLEALRTIWKAAYLEKSGRTILLDPLSKQQQKLLEKSPDESYSQLRGSLRNPDSAWKHPRRTKPVSLSLRAFGTSRELDGLWEFSPKEEACHQSEDATPALNPKCYADWHNSVRMCQGAYLKKPG